MFKFVIGFVLILQVFASYEEVPLLKPVAQSSAIKVGATDVEQNFIVLPLSSIRVPLSVLDLITGTDNSHLLKKACSQPTVMVTALQMQNGLNEMDELHDALDKMKSRVEHSAIVTYVSQMPCALVQFEGGSVLVSKKILQLFKALTSNCNGYSPLENLLINWCCFQAEASLALMRAK